MRSRVSCASAPSAPVAFNISMNPELSKPARSVKPGPLDSHPVTRRPGALASWLCLPLALLLGCGTDEPARRASAAKPADALDAQFPPLGPIELRHAAPPAEGTLYQLQIRFEGRSEVQGQGPNAGDPQFVDELLQMELDYRQEPVASPQTGDVASSLVLDALRRRQRLIPPGVERGLEVGDDRIRVLTEDKIDIDLRGAQPKGDLTPRAVLNRPFALLVNDARGNPKSVTLRGIPSAKRLLASLPIRESVSFVQLALPEGPVSPGATWNAKRFLANPIGRLGVGLDIEHRLLGFERIDGVPCAHVSLRAKYDGDDAQSELGFTFEKLRFELQGDAFVSLATHQVELLRIEDIAAVSYKRTTGANPAAVRMRYEGRTALRRLDAATTSKQPWADGTKRFTDVKKNDGK
jgi:hypothetical protein